jgi:uncharacterized membrane protein
MALFCRSLQALPQLVTDKFLGASTADLKSSSKASDNLRKTVTIVEWILWIIPIVLLVVVIIIFTVNYNKYEKKKKVQNALIQEELASLETAE